MPPPRAPSHRVVDHPPICPDCESPDITTDEIETSDGLTETAFICRACGAAWPLACVTDWAAGHDKRGSPSWASSPAGGM